MLRDEPSFPQQARTEGDHHTAGGKESCFTIFLEALPDIRTSDFPACNLQMFSQFSCPALNPCLSKAGLTGLKVLLTHACLHGERFTEILWQVTPKFKRSITLPGLWGKQGGCETTSLHFQCHGDTAGGRTLMPPCTERWSLTAWPLHPPRLLQTWPLRPRHQMMSLTASPNNH